MSKFDAQKARDGYPVEYLRFTADDGDDVGGCWEPVHFIGIDSYGAPVIEDKAGKVFVSPASSLRLRPKQVTRYVNLYIGKTAEHFATEHEATAAANNPLNSHAAVAVALPVTYEVDE